VGKTRSGESAPNKRSTKETWGRGGGWIDSRYQGREINRASQAIKKKHKKFGVGKNHLGKTKDAEREETVLAQPLQRVGKAGHRCCKWRKPHRQREPQVLLLKSIGGSNEGVF